MEEIKVIIDTSRHIDPTTMPPDERQDYFDELAEVNKDAPLGAYRDYSAIFGVLREAQTIAAYPDLPELIVRKIIALSVGLSGYPRVVPIVDNVRFRGAGSGGRGKTVRALATLKTQMTNNHARAKDTQATGPAWSQLKVRFGRRTTAMQQRGAVYVIGADEEIIVKGLHITPFCYGAAWSAGSGASTHTHDLVSGRWTSAGVWMGCDAAVRTWDKALKVAGDTHEGPYKLIFSTLTEHSMGHILRSLHTYYILLSLQSAAGLEAAEIVHGQITAMIERAQTHRGRSFADAQPFVTRPYVSLPPPKPVGKDAVIDLLNTTHAGRITRSTPEATDADVWGRGLNDIYVAAKLRGMDDEAAQDYLLEYKAAVQARRDRYAFLQRREDERSRITLLKVIIEKKLGATRAAAVDKILRASPGKAGSYKGVLSVLAPDERKLVEIEYDKKQKYFAAVLNNKCPHVRAMRRFRRALSARESHELLENIRADYFKSGTMGKDQMIQCKVCGFDLICPHVVAREELEYARKPHAEIKAAMTAYIDRALRAEGGSRKYHCKICGEIVSSAAPTIVGLTDHRDEELNELMWGEIVSLIRYLQFGNLVDVGKLIANVRDACYPYVYDIEKQILKSKTNTPAEITAKKRIYISIYAMAYLIHLMISNRGREGAEDISFKGFRVRDKKRETVELIRHGLETIVSAKNTAMKVVAGLTTDVVKAAMVDAFKSLQVKGAQIITHADSPEEILATMLLDPVYKYIYLVNEIASGKPSHKPHSRLVEYFGRVEQTGKNDDVFGNAKSPALGAFLKHPAPVAFRAGDNAAKYGPWYFAQSFIQFFARVKGRTYLHPVYVDDSSDDVVGSKFSPKYAAMAEEFAEFAARERVLLMHKRLSRAQGYVLFEVPSPRWPGDRVRLSRVFGEDGHRHAWTKFVVGEEDKDKKDYAAALAAGQGLPRPTGMRCAKCRILRSETAKLDESTIHDALQHNYILANFARFYAVRCPAPNAGESTGLHDGIPCSKCGYTGKVDDAYFKKYIEVYEREKITRVELAPAPPMPALPEFEDLGRWKHQFSIINGLAEKVGVNQRLIMAIGAMEKQRFADVESGKYVPPEIETPADTRIYKIVGYIKNMLVEYNQLRRAAKILKPPAWLAELLDGAGIPRHQLQHIAGNMPAVGEDFFARVDAIKRTLKPRDIVLYLLEYLCAALTQIHAANKLGASFAAGYLKKALRAEELTTKAGYFNWALLYDDGKEPAKSDSNYDAELGEAPGADDDEAPEDEGDTNAPFQNEFDMEDADDEDANQVRVNDDSGLD